MCVCVCVCERERERERERENVCVCDDDDDDRAGMRGMYFEVGVYVGKLSLEFPEHDLLLQVLLLRTPTRHMSALLY